MDSTPNLDLPYIAAAQAQKHVTHNEAIRALDAIVQLAVLDRDLSAPPATPADGDRYIVAASSTGAWTDRDAQLAAYQDGAWQFFRPQTGWVAWIADEGRLLGWDGSTWRPVATDATVNPTPLVGVNATADTTNRLSLNATASLFNHDGSGHQLKINKAGESDTASLLFQSGFSGRAEFGLPSTDDFSVKVSADGSIWHDALITDGASGRITFPQHVGFGLTRETVPTHAIDTAGAIRLRNPSTPASATAAGAQGEIRWDANYVYVCVAANRWGRLPLQLGPWPDN